MSVTIKAHPETGEVFTQKQGGNPEWGTIRVDTPSKIVVENGIMDERKRSAFLRMKKSLFEKLDLKEGQQLPGTVIYKTSSFPQYEGHEAKINPSTKEIIVDEEGNPIYFTAHYVTDEDAKDEVLVEEQVSTTEEELKESQSL